MAFPSPFLGGVTVWPGPEDENVVALVCCVTCMYFSMLPFSLVAFGRVVPQFCLVFASVVLFGHGICQSDEMCEGF